LVRRILLIAGLAVVLGYLGPSRGVQAASVGGTLTVAYSAPPATLDPAKNAQATSWYDYPAYDAFFRQESNGKFTPDLATSGKYVGTSNKIFDLTLRKGVRFSDGSALTAAGVKAWFDYFIAAKGPQASLLVGFKSAKVTGPLTVRLTLTTPNPLLKALLSQQWLAGDVPSPNALKNPAKLGTGTYGTGPYKLDPSQTVTNDHYTYVPNPYYWNKGAVHYHKLVIRVISNPSAVLQAMNTGQVSVAVGDPSTAAAAKSSGLKVLGVPQLFEGLDFTDRTGALVKPLGDVRVRQAINYALNRKAITKATIPIGGVATDEVSTPGLDGWVQKDNTYYSYNVSKAKALLKAAGYANGFTLPILTTSLVGQDLGTQAIAAQLQQIGIHVDLTDDGTFNQYVADLVGGKFPAIQIAYGGLPMFIEGPSLYLRDGVFNPLHASDSQIESWWSQAAGARASVRTALYHKIEHRLITQAWFAIYGIAPLFYYTTSHVTGVVAQGGYIPNLVEFAPK
jgi:peptide/nickel transport system substrate-binding protein